MPTVTALRDDRRGRIAIELDGAPWRTVPIDVVVRAGLAEGRTLDRAGVRLFRRELRRAEALAFAARALRSRDLPHGRVAERLERAAVPPAVVTESLAVLEAAGVVDDSRFAANRAQALAGRGYGDAAISHDLERQGIAGELVAEALKDLEPELARARRIVDQRGPGPRTARYLATRGFGEEALEAALGAAFEADRVARLSLVDLDGD
jgi:SOS response regulatory protein OraA/RecX